MNRFLRMLFVRPQEENLRAKVSALETQRTYLIKTIRDMDQEIWNMSQKPSWDLQRPHFTKLLEGTKARKHIESERIGALVQDEIESTYDPKGTHRQITRRA